MCVCLRQRVPSDRHTDFNIYSVCTYIHVIVFAWLQEPWTNLSIIFLQISIINESCTEYYLSWDKIMSFTARMQKGVREASLRGVSRWLDAWPGPTQRIVFSCYSCLFNPYTGSVCPRAQKTRQRCLIKMTGIVTTGTKNWFLNMLIDSPFGSSCFMPTAWDVLRT